MKERLDNEKNGYGLDEIHDTGSGNDGNREAKARVATPSIGCRNSTRE